MVELGAWDVISDSAWDSELGDVGIGVYGSLFCLGFGWECEGLGLRACIQHPKLETAQAPNPGADIFK